MKQGRMKIFFKKGTAPDGKPNSLCVDPAGVKIDEHGNFHIRTSDEYGLIIPRDVVLMIEDRLPVLEVVQEVDERITQ